MASSQERSSSGAFSHPSSAALRPSQLTLSLCTSQAPKSIEKARFRSAAEIRHQKDLEISQREQQGLPLVGRLTEMQLHNFYKRVRYDPQRCPATLFHCNRCL